jgi:hypothetical protein
VLFHTANQRITRSDWSFLMKNKYGENQVKRAKISLPNREDSTQITTNAYGYTLIFASPCNRRSVADDG